MRNQGNRISLPCFRRSVRQSRLSFFRLRISALSRHQVLNPKKRQDAKKSDPRRRPSEKLEPGRGEPVVLNQLLESWFHPPTMKKKPTNPIGNQSRDGTWSKNPGFGVDFSGVDIIRESLSLLSAFWFIDDSWIQSFRRPMLMTAS